MDQQDVTLTDTLSILPWERKEEMERREEGRLGEEKKKGLGDTPHTHFISKSLSGDCAP